MNRRLFAAVATAAFVCLGVLAPAASASAEGVPPSALPDCTGEAPETGGWAIRDNYSTGTSATEPSDVRPRSARLGEPCFDDVGFGDPPLMLPVRLTDLPVPILDEDENGEDDGAPDVGSEGTSETVCVIGTCATIVGMVDQNWQPSGTRHSYTRVCWSITASLTGLTVMLDMPEDPAELVNPGWAYQPTTGANTSADSWQAGEATISLTAYTGGLGNSGAYDPDTVTCPSGTTHYSSNDIAGSTLPTEKRVDPLRIGLRLNSTGVISWADMTTSSTLGTGYYGGTQAAQFVFGAGSDFSVPEDGSIVCSPNYDGSGATSHPIDVKTAGSFDDVDRSPDPPVVVDGVATDWSTWKGYYPTDVGSGGVYLSNCPYLVSITFWVCSYTGHSPLEFGCSEVQWSADRWRERNAYQGTDADDPDVGTCTIYPNTPGCFEVLNPTPIDGTDFAVACAGAPEPTWAVWDWLFPWVGHMAECLFVPLNGWDRLGWVASAWEGGAGGDMTDTLTALGDALVVDGGCGVLLEGEVVGSEVAIDTCSWSWASDGRVMLYWFILVTGCFAAIMFLMKTIFGIIDGRTPTPFDEDK